MSLHRDHIYAKCHLTEAIIDGITAFLYEGTILSEERYAVSKVKNDPEDDKFLACAEGGAIIPKTAIIRRFHRFPQIKQRAGGFAVCT